MPTVSLYGSPKVAPSALPGVRKTAAETPESEGAGLDLAQARQDEQIAQLGGTIANIGLHEFADIQAEERKRANETALLDADNQAASFENKALYDPQTGALSQRGKNALGVPEQVLGQFDQAQTAIAAGLTNDEQRTTFAKAMQTRRDRLDVTLRRHTMEQMNAYEADTLNDFMVNKKEEAANNANDPDRFSQSIADGVKALRTAAPHQGWSGDSLQKRVDDFTTGASVAVINRLLNNGNVAGAQAVFDHLGPGSFDPATGQKSGLDIIKGDALGNIEAALQVGTEKKAEQDAAREILAKPDLSLQEQRALADKLDPKLQDGVKARLEHEHGVQEQAKRENEESQLTTAFGIVDKTHSIDQIPPAMQVALAQHLPALRSYAASLTKDGKITTDWNTFYELYGQATADDKETKTAFAKVNLLAYKHLLGDTEFKQLTEAQGGIRRGDLAAADRVLPGFRTKAQIVDDTLRQFGIEPTGPGVTDATKEQISSFRHMLDLDVAVEEAKHKKPATNEFIEQRAYKILSTTQGTKGSWYGLIPFSGVSLFDHTRKLLELTIDDMPPATKKLLTDKIRGRGREPSDVELLNLWREGILASQK